jgi:hypothetical protein
MTQGYVDVEKAVWAILGCTVRYLYMYMYIIVYATSLDLLTVCMLHESLKPKKLVDLAVVGASYG